MERHTKFDNTEKPKSWNDLLGPFFHYDKLPESMRNEDGLIVLETSSGQKVCPAGQFDPTIISEDGRISPTIDPWISALWKIAKEFEVKQLESSIWATAATILTPLRGSEVSFAERLFACTDDQSKEAIIMEYVARSENGARWASVELALPHASS